AITYRSFRKQVWRRAAAGAMRCQDGGVSEPAIPARRGRPGYDQAQVLEIAVQVFNEQGYDATSVSTLAERLGLSKSALYHHFSSKEQLLETALEQALGDLEEVLREA